MRPITAPASSQSPAVAIPGDARALRMERYFVQDAPRHDDAGASAIVEPAPDARARLDILVRRRSRRARMDARW